MCCDATIAVNALLPVKGTLIHLLCVDGATWSWWQPRQLALGRVGAFRLKSFSETGLKSTACWVTERGDVCFPSLMLFCFTHITVGPSICMVDKVAKSRGKNDGEGLEIGTEQAAPSSNQAG